MHRLEILTSYAELEGLSPLFDLNNDYVVEQDVHISHKIRTGRRHGDLKLAIFTDRDPQKLYASLEQHPAVFSIAAETCQQLMQDSGPTASPTRNTSRTPGRTRANATDSHSGDSSSRIAGAASSINCTRKSAGNSVQLRLESAIDPDFMLTIYLALVEMKCSLKSCRKFRQGNKELASLTLGPMNSTQLDNFERLVNHFCNTKPAAVLDKPLHLCDAIKMDSGNGTDTPMIVFSIGPSPVTEVERLELLLFLAREKLDVAMCRISNGGAVTQDSFHVKSADGTPFTQLRLLEIQSNMAE